MSKIQEILDELGLDNQNEGIISGVKKALGIKPKFKFRYYDRRTLRWVFSDKSSNNIHTAKKEIEQALKSHGVKFIELEVIPKDDIWVVPKDHHPDFHGVDKTQAELSRNKSRAKDVIDKVNKSRAFGTGVLSLEH